MSLLEVRGLSVRAHGVAVRGVDLTVSSGETVALLGDASASALVRTVAGLLAPLAGVVRVDGDDVTGLSYPEVAARGVAVVRTGVRAFAEVTAREQVLVGAWGRAERADAVLGWFPDLDPAERADAIEGERAVALAIAAALARAPRLLLVDRLPPYGADSVVLGGLRAAARDGTASLVAAELPAGARPSPASVAAFDTVLLCYDGVLRG